MFRSLGSVLCVVVMAAFVFGCGGGGGGTAQPPDPPPMEPTPPAGPTDAERIAEVRGEIAGILSNAQTRASAVSAAARAIQANDDALDAQKTSANTHDAAAQSALARIVSANSTAQTATTLAAVRTALESAKTAETDLNTADSAITTIRNALQMVADDRQRRARDVLALTNNSSLIQHVRANKLVFDAILDDLKDSTTDPLTIGPTVADTSEAEYPKNTGTGADRVVGMRTVAVTPVTGTTLTSNSTTTTLTGTSTLPHGFDLKNTAGTIFVNAYTDITQTRVVQNKITEIAATTDGSNGAVTRADVDMADTDYLLAGIWIQDNKIEAFAYGSQPITSGATIASPCDVTEGDSVVYQGRTRVCNSPTSVNNISDFVEDGRNVNATYRGQANGARLAAGETSYFTADVNLTATFVNPTSSDGSGADSNGSIEGAVTNISVGGQLIEGSIELQKHTFENDIGAAWETTTDDPVVAIGVVEGNAYTGNWKGQFFGQKFRRFSRNHTVDTNTPTATTTVDYKLQAPGSVAGNFYVVKQSTPGDEAFIGAFGANR